MNSGALLAQRDGWAGRVPGALPETAENSLVLDALQRVPMRTWPFSAAPEHCVPLSQGTAELSIDLSSLTAHKYLEGSDGTSSTCAGHSAWHLVALTARGQ